jgi:hypothetical protein
MSRGVFLSRPRLVRAPRDAARTKVIRSAIVSLATPAFLCVAMMSNAQVRFALPESASSSPTSEAAVQPPAAQTAATHWTLEVRGGFGFSTNPSAGAGQLPGLGAILSPASSTQGPVRAVSSWFFGDGAAQLNSIAASASPPAPPLSPLDSMLTTRSANRGSGSTFGVTISRDLSAHLSADFNLDRNNQPFGLTSAAASAIESTRAGFVATWQPLLAATHPDAVAMVSASPETVGVTSAGIQIEASGTLTYRLKPGSGFDPFITIGAGILANHGSTLSSALIGNYSVAVPNPVFHDIQTIVAQQDMVTINLADRGSRLVGILGGGIEKALSAQGGFRFAARLALGSNHPEATIDASPTTPIGPPGPSNPLFGVVPTISNGATTVILPTTLSGPSLTGFKTFSGKGTRIETTITVGYFFRF